MTYSVGFRAPSHRDLVGSFLQHALEQVDPDVRYSDPGLDPVEHPGAVQEAARAKVRRLLRDFVAEDEDLDRWFGRYLTRPPRNREALPPDPPTTASAITDALERGVGLRRGPVANLAFIEHDDGTATLFVNGEAHDLDADEAHAAPLVSGREIIPAEILTPHLDDAAVVDLLVSLVNEGVLELDRDE